MVAVLNRTAACVLQQKSIHPETAIQSQRHRWSHSPTVFIRFSNTKTQSAVPQAREYQTRRIPATYSNLKNAARILAMPLHGERRHSRGPETAECLTSAFFFCGCALSCANRDERLGFAAGGWFIDSAGIL